MVTAKYKGKNQHAIIANRNYHHFLVAPKNSVGDWILMTPVLIQMQKKTETLAHILGKKTEFFATVTHREESGNHLQRRVFCSKNETVRGFSFLSFKIFKKRTPCTIILSGLTISGSAS